MSHKLNPDKLLEALDREESREKRGKLKVFLGMCAGVGKTYAMLQAAQKAKQEGINVWIGYIETHGRQETEALLTDLPEIPRQKIAYRGTYVSAFDLDAALQKKPQLILVDELAHHNAPQQRHQKRYQDVLELLKAGHDVYTTLNVQHLESQAEWVQNMTGVPIHERVPDALLDEADEIQLIDLSPEALIARIKEGKVYASKNIQQATQNFFQLQYLIALREIALRITANHVDRDLKHILAQQRRPGALQVQAKLMVAIGPSPSSATLIRFTRRMAQQIGCPWIALHVENNATPTQNESLRKNIQLVQALGGEMAYTQGSSLHQALLHAAEEHRATQLILGKPRQSLWQDLFNGRARHLYQLFYQSESLDIWMVDSYQKSSGPKSKPLPSQPRLATRPHHFATVIFSLILTTGLGVLLSPLIGYASVGLMFLTLLVALSLFVSYPGILLGALFSAASWNFFFIPPLHTFYIQDAHNALMCILYFGVALFTGSLVRRIKKEQSLGQEREKRLFTLYQFHQNVLSQNTAAEVIENAQIQLSHFLACPVILTTDPQKFETADTREDAVRNWVYRNQEPAGRFTSSLSLAENTYLPIAFKTRIYGVLSFCIGQELAPSQHRLLETLNTQLAQRLETFRLQEQAKTAELNKLSDSLYEALLNSVSHELKTPITTIQGVIHNLQEEPVQKNPKLVQSLLLDLQSAGQRLKHIVSNLLDASRLESGKLVLNRGWHDLNDIVRAGIEPLKNTLHHDFQFDMLLSAEPMPIWGDFGLLEQVIHNLLHNAILHTPPQSSISLSTHYTKTHWEVIIADNGPGLSAEDLPHLFEKFYQGHPPKTGGTGLGLSICKGIIEAHQGSIEAYNSIGAVFRIKVPIQKSIAFPNTEEDE